MSTRHTHQLALDCSAKFLLNPLCRGSICCLCQGAICQLSCWMFIVISGQNLGTPTPVDARISLLTYHLLPCHCHSVLMTPPQANGTFLELWLVLETAGDFGCALGIALPTPTPEGVDIIPHFHISIMTFPESSFTLNRTEICFGWQDGELCFKRPSLRIVVESNRRPGVRSHAPPMSLRCSLLTTLHVPSHRRPTSTFHHSWHHMEQEGLLLQIVFMQQVCGTGRGGLERLRWLAHKHRHVHVKIITQMHIYMHCAKTSA